MPKDISGLFSCVLVAHQPGVRDMCNRVWLFSLALVNLAVGLIRLPLTVLGAAPDTFGLKRGDGKGKGSFQLHTVQFVRW